jgi:hypothetical protein
MGTEELKAIRGESRANVTEYRLALYLPAKVGYPEVLAGPGVTLLPQSASNDRRPGGLLGVARRRMPGTPTRKSAKVDLPRQH